MWESVLERKRLSERAMVIERERERVGLSVCESKVCVCEREYVREIW